MNLGVLGIQMLQQRLPQRVAVGLEGRRDEAVDEGGQLACHQRHVEVVLLEHAGGRAACARDAAQIDACARQHGPSLAIDVPASALVAIPRVLLEDVDLEAVRLGAVGENASNA